jgi:DNA invertase Pin-like site-specific DNA recombinase
MSTNGTNGPRLEGTGASYLRVSRDRQEVERQLASIAAFEKRHGVCIAPQHRYEDDMPRDLSDRRPDFQRMLKAALAGQLQWIVVDSLDRFGTKSAKRLMGYLADLEDAGCRLLDAQGKEWTGEDDGTEIAAWVGGKTSTREQKEKSLRCLGGMVAKAKGGEWMGGPPRLGFDVACFDRGTGAEVWRVVWEGRDEVGTTKRKGKMRPVYHIRRLKVYPDGPTERLDGNVVFRTSKDSQVMRIVPTADAAKLAAVKGIFARFAGEAVSLFGLAKWLNGLGLRNSFGQTFQSNDIRKLLRDEAYLGYPTFRKRRSGRFHRFDAAGGVVELEPELRGKETVSDPADVIRSATRLYEPLVDRPTWAAVQRKLNHRA